MPNPDDDVIYKRVLSRLVDEKPDEIFIRECMTTVTDRLSMRLAMREVPEVGNSLIVDAVVKMWRRYGYEGVSRESVGEGGSISTSFVDSILDEYKDEIAGIVKMFGDDMDSVPTVRFL